MIIHACDECGKKVNTATFPPSWVTMLMRSQGKKELVEKHFCSWECLAAHRKKEKIQIA